MQKIAALLASLVLSAALVSGTANAQTATQPMGASPRVEQGMQKLQTRFAHANTTHDGKLTRDQAVTGLPVVAKHFDEIDTLGNGYVTLSQIEAFLRGHTAQR
ncbi:EF-hand domain-containing protein [Caballeronia sp. Lep1P3]|uniref:EF-hand domain-containing protein n=1 Tax=Caballeronia sp. Lep1P3 TaxID=2878150 RepID=UPI001FD3CA13|nr:EF-hand domain-containing protein [Caballeronia sp. Lep1P3]